MASLMSLIIKPMASKTQLFHSFFHSSNRLLSTNTTSRSFRTLSNDSTVDPRKISDEYHSQMMSACRSFDSMQEEIEGLPFSHPARLECVKTIFRLPFVEEGPKWVYDVKEDSKALYVRVDMPGVHPEGVRVWIESDRLCFTGEEKEKPDLEYDKLVLENPRKFSGRLHLPTNCEHYQLDQIKAKMRNGVLRIAVPKTKAQMEVITVEESNV